MKRLPGSVLMIAVLGAGLTAFLPAESLGHEHWIDAESFYPEPHDTVEVYISSGHYFPKSAHALGDDVIDAFRVFRKGGEPTLLESRVRDDSRIAMLGVNEAGVHILHLRLRRPRAKKPSFEAKAILIAGGSEDNPEQYSVGDGLELIPQTTISLLSPGGELPLQLAIDGQPVTGSLEVVPEHGRTAFLSTTADSAAMISVRTAGKYLVTAHSGGRGCSLVFEVRQGEAEEEGKELGEDHQGAREESLSDGPEENRE